MIILATLNVSRDKSVITGFFFRLEKCSGADCLKKVSKINYDWWKGQPIRTTYFVVNHYLTTKQ